MSNAVEVQAQEHIVVRKIENGYLLERDYGATSLYFPTIHSVANYFVSKGIETPNEKD